MNRFRTSLWWHLTAWSFGALLIGWAVLMVLSARATEHQAADHRDQMLASVASVMARQAHTDFLTRAPQSDTTQPSVFVWDRSGRLLTQSGSAPVLPFLAREGFSTIATGPSPELWRSYTQWDASERNRKITVMVKLEQPGAVGAVLAQVSTHLGWLLPVLAALVGLAIYVGLRPLRKVCDGLEGTGATARSPVAPARYAELDRIVQAFNFSRTA